MVIMMMFNILTCLTFNNIQDNDYHDDDGDDNHDYVDVINCQEIQESR